MMQLWSEKEFCKITGLSIRTLHYHDEQNILVPSYKRENGTRYYSLENLLTVQKITTLKYGISPQSETVKFVRLTRSI